MKKKLIALAAICALGVSLLAGCGRQETNNTSSTESVEQLVYASNDYTRINPALDEHGEINLLIFDGLTTHNSDNNIDPALADSWSISDDGKTYTFLLNRDAKWQDGEAFSAEDVKFTIETIMANADQSEIASNYTDIEKITVEDPQTITFELKNRNEAFLEYMTVPILPKHLLEGKDMQTDEYFKHPIGTGPYKIASWTEGQSIVLTKNEEYFKGEPNIDTVVFKIVPDDNAKALQLKSGEVNLTQVTPKDAKAIADDSNYHVYEFKTADYRGIMYNFNNKYWKKNKELIPAFNYAIDRQAMIDAVLLGEGDPAYSPIQLNTYNDASIEHFSYNPSKAKEIIENAGWKLNKNGIYEKNGKELGFTITVKEGDQVRADLVQVAIQQLKAVGVSCKAEISANPDWENQQAFLIGWGSPFDADDHTYKVFGSGQGSNFNAYSDTVVDEALTNARQTNLRKERAKYYSEFLTQMTKNPPYTFFCYLDANYASNVPIEGITTDTVLGHHGVGIFWNVENWKLK